MMRFEKTAAEPIVLDRNWVYDFDRPRGHGKPAGLWVSVPGEYGWPQWCADTYDDYGDRGVVTHEVIVDDVAAVHTIGSKDEMYAFHDEYAVQTDFDHDFDDVRGAAEGLPRKSFWPIDWRKVADSFDGIVITPYLWECRLDSSVNWYYTWDCASGCIWNLDAIVSVTPIADTSEAVA